MFFKSAFLGLLATLAVLRPTAATFLRHPLSSGCGKDPQFDNGVYNITVNGTLREFIVRLPNEFDPYIPYKLVVALHWYGGTMNDVASDTPNKYGNGSYFGLVPLGGGSTIFVAPNGLNKGWMNTNDMDLQFIDALVAAIGDGLCVDQWRRYAIGFSFGGSMAYAIANTRADTFRAVGILSGTDFTPWSGTPAPMPVFISHGVSDPANPISKGRLMRDHFLDINGCVHIGNASEPEVGSGTHISTFYWFCTSGKKVEYLAFDGVHQFSPVDAGATESYLPWKIWEFFMLA